MNSVFTCRAARHAWVCWQRTWGLWHWHLGLLLLRGVGGDHAAGSRLLHQLCHLAAGLAAKGLQPSLCMRTATTKSAACCTGLVMSE